MRVSNLLAAMFWAAVLASAFMVLHAIIHSNPPPDPIIHRLIQPNPAFHPEDGLYQKPPVSEAQVFRKLHLVRPDLIQFPLDTRYYA